jgi:hypothetical protein
MMRMMNWLTGNSTSVLVVFASVLDPKLFDSDPDPTVQKALDLFLDNIPVPFL